MEGQDSLKDADAEGLSTPFPIKNPYVGEPFCWIGGYPVTAEQITRFSKLMVTPVHTQNPHETSPDIDILSGIKPFGRVFAVGIEGLDLGLGNVSEVRSAMEMFELSAIGNDYMLWLVDNAPVSAEDVNRKLPSRWVKINFQMKVVEMENREAAKLVPMSQATWEKLEMDYNPSGVNNIPETGLVFPDAGFFDPIDDAYLFTLEEGEISRPVMTGLGLAFVRVKERKEYTDEDKNMFLVDMRKKLAGAYANNKFGEALTRVEPSLFPAAFQKAVQQEVASGVRGTDPVVFSYQDISLKYSVFREIHQVDLNLFSKIHKGDAFMINLVAELRSFAARLVMGKLAMEDGLLDLEAKWDKAAYDYFIRRLFNVTMEEVLQQAKQGLTEVTDEDARAFYQANVDKFSRPEQMKVTYVPSPVRASLEKLLPMVQRDASTLETISSSMLPNAPHGQKGARVVRVERGGPNLADVHEDLFKLRDGDVRILDSLTNHYLVRVDAHVDRKVNHFEEISEVVKNTLELARIQAGVDEFLEKVEEKYPVTYNKQQLEQKGITLPGNEDFS
jgi:hypothetical protein